MYALETRCSDTWHTTETVSWLVVEAGSWGSLQAGMLRIEDFEWYRVQFHAPMDECAPAQSAGRYVLPRVEQMEASLSTEHSTYRLAASLQPTAQNVYTIFGSAATPLAVPAAFQLDGAFGSNFGGVSPALFAHSADAAFDSWLTVGLTEGDTAGALSSIGIDWAAWTWTDALTTTDGAVFWLDPGGGPAGSAVVAQLTVSASFSGVVTMGMQGRSSVAGSEDWQEAASFEVGSAQPCAPGSTVAMSQVMTVGGGHFVKTRQRAVDANGFDVRLEEEGVDDNHNPETVGWVALPAQQRGRWRSAWSRGSVRELRLRARGAH